MQILFSGAIPGRDEPRGVTALLGIVDAETGELLHRCEYRTPSELQAPGQKMQFTGSAGADGRLYVCSHNEIVWFDDWPPTAPAGRVSIPGFNDLHHCIPWEGGLAVANTGLETVDHVSLEGELLERWDLLEGLADARRIDPELEYNRLEDTKPHRVHANHLFVRQGELWVTQLLKCGAVCVKDLSRRVQFDTGNPHDGRYIDGRLVFTTTNGHLVELDPESLDVLARHDLGRMTPDAEMLGWCRGVCEAPGAPRSFHVGFSFPRRSKWREYAFRVKFGENRLPSRLGLYDVERAAMVRSFEMLPDQSLVLFQLDALPEPRWI